MKWRVKSFAVSLGFFLVGCTDGITPMSTTGTADGELTGAELTPIDDEGDGDGNPTPTTTPSPSGSPGVSPSVTPTATPSRSPNISPTPTPTPSKTPWQSKTPTPTPTPTKTPYCTPTPIPKPHAQWTMVKDIDNEKNTCSLMLGIPAHKIVVSGNGQAVKISSDSGLLLRVSGSESVVNVALNGKGIVGVCVIAVGDENRVGLVLSAPIKHAFLQARGNQNQIAVEFSEDGAVTGKFSANVRGNQNRITVVGEGPHACPQPDIAGNGSTVECPQ